MKIEIDIPDDIYQSIDLFLKNSQDFKDISDLINRSLTIFLKTNNFLLTTKKILDNQLVD
ncbi:MAG: hypothetical protein EAX96_07610 [Candidatus Lokiarchaeota archaeon]|nr:hypothetical protein [Candidatus Lokiarchaeota archaeon]